MPANPKHKASMNILGQITRPPEGSATSAGVPVCRFTVAKEASGPAGSSVIVVLYAVGELAERCLRGLGLDDLVEGFGDLAPMRRGARHPEVIVHDLKLRREVSGRASAARAGAAA